MPLSEAHERIWPPLGGASAIADPRCNAALIRTLWAGVLAVFAVAVVMAMLLAAPDVTLALVILCAISGTALLLALGRTRLYLLLLGAYFVGILGFSRQFALLGISPVYVPELLFVAATLASVPVWAPQLRHVKALLFCAAALAGFDVVAVIRGVAAGYPSAVKGAALGLWPSLALVFACTLRARPQLWRFAPYLGIVSAGGLVAAALLGSEVVDSAYGVYFLVPVAFLAVGKMTPRRVLLALACLIGVGLLLAEGSKRSPALALVVAVLATRLATGGRRGRGGKGLLTVVGAAFAVTLAILMAPSLSGAPVVGGLFGRVAATTQRGSEASANVAVRFAFWQYALVTVAEQHPLTGVGTGHPIAVDFNDHSFAHDDIGPHNSFVGYAFYLGYPSGLLVVGLFGAALYRLWRSSPTDPVAAPMFGAMVGLTVLVATNVVFETTYIGGPAWLICGAAFARPPAARVPRLDREIQSTSPGTQ